MDGVGFDMASWTSEIPPNARYHVKAVYNVLAVLVAAMACGLGLNLYVRVPNMLMAIATFGSMMYYATLPVQNVARRTTTLMVFAFCSGASLALLGASLHVIFVGVSATAIMFACFSGAALLAKRRSYLYLGAMLSSAVSMMFWFSMASWMFPNRLNYTMQLYGGLLIFAGYVVFDTQVMVERAASVEKPDVLTDAMKLFMDLVAILRRVIIILTERERSKNGRSRARENDSGMYSSRGYGARPHRARSSFGSGASFTNQGMYRGAHVF